MSDVRTHTGPDPSGVGSAARKWHARVYVTRIRPLMVVLGIAAASLDWIDGLRDIARAEFTAVAIQGGSQLVLALLLAFAVVTPLAAARASIVVDLVAITALVVMIPHPALVAGCYVILVPLVGYFASPRTTLVSSAVIALGIIVLGPRLDGWDDPTVIPWSAFFVGVIGITTSFIASRMRATEHALVERAEDEHAARMRLEQVDRSRDRLIANVSHELRTPLTATLGSIETLLRDDVEIDDGQRELLLRNASDGGRRLLRLVEDLLTLGATRPDSLRLSMEREQLSTLVAVALENVDAGVGRAVRVKVDDDASVCVDRSRMLQVVENLVVNGIRHGGGDVCVETASRDGRAVLRVVDDGPGVPPEHAEELFQPFARFSTRPDSNGLGLAICRTIVEAHGGSIGYERTDDHRTVFTVDLPAEQ